MTDIITDCLLIACIWTGVFYSGFPAEIESMIGKRVKFGTFRIPKPFSCALCMTFWTCLIWTLCVYGFSLANVLICLIAGLFTTVLDNLYSLVFDTLNTLLVRINERLNS